MASPGAIAIRRQAAIRAIQAQANRLADVLQVDPPALPQRGRDPGLLMAQQLEAVAAWLADVADGATALAPAPAGKGKDLTAVKPKKTRGEGL